MTAELRLQLLSLVPSLRAFAFCLVQDQAEADDLLHGSLIDIWLLHGHKRGAELKLGAFASVHAKFRRRERPSPPLAVRSPLNLKPGYEGAFGQALMSLPTSERETLSLVAAWEFNAEETAGICGIDPEMVRHCITTACNRLNADFNIGQQAQSVASPLH